MSFNVRAFFASIANTAALQAVAFLGDRIGPANADNTMRVTTERNLFGAYAFGTNLQRANLSSAALRRFNPVDVRPIANAAAGAGAQAQMYWSPRSGYLLDVGESLQAQAQQNSAGAQNAYAIVFTGSGDFPASEPRATSVRATSATALVANAWTTVPLVFDSGLPNHRVSVVGGRCESAGILAWRLIVPGLSFFPGHLGCQAATALDPPGSRDGALGVWCQFDPNFPPQLEVLSTSTDATQTLWLDLVDAGPSPY